MSPAERATLLRCGVTYGIIQRLEAAGYSGLKQLAKATHQQLAATPGVGTLGAYQVQRAIGQIADRARSPH
jgi:hypothetical protein